MARNLLLLLVLLLLAGGGTALVLWEGPSRAATVADGIAAEPEKPPRPAPVGTGEGEASPATPERRALESPADGGSPASAPASTLLEGLVRESGGKGLPRVQVQLLAHRLGKEKELERALRSMAQMQQMILGLREKGAATGMAAVDLARMLESMSARGGFKPLASGETDEEGRYRFDPVSLPAGEEALFLTARPLAGYLYPDPVQLQAVHLGPGRGPDLLLLRGARIEGMVVGLEPGREGAEVRAWRLGEKAAQDRLQSWAQGAGTFSFDGLRPGTWRLALVRPFREPAFAWGPALILAEGQKVEGVRLVLAPSALLEVDVLGPGRTPMDLGCQVELGLKALGPAGEEGGECAVEETLFQIPRKDGEPWRLEGLVPGSYRLKASLAQTFAFWSRSGVKEEKKEGKESEAPLTVVREVELVQGPNRFELVFDRLPSLTEVEIRVRDRKGAPVREASVTLFTQGSGVFLQPRSLRTGSDGVAQARNLLPLKHQLHVHGQGFLSEQFEVDLTGEPGGGVVRRELVLRRGGTIVGRLLDQEGQGIPRARIRARGEGEGEGRPMVVSHGFSGDFITVSGGRSSAATDENGGFRLAGLAPGRWELVPRVEGRDGVPLAVEVAEEELKEVELRF